MNRPFYTGPASPAFGSFHNNNGSAGDYIIRKKNKSKFCNTELCKDVNLQFMNQGDYIAAYKEFISNEVFFNKSNLNINLITKLNLKNVCVIENNKTKLCPTTIDLCTIPYLAYTIDPNGALFGNTYCGANNYLNYVQYNISEKNIPNVFQQ